MAYLVAELVEKFGMASRGNLDIEVSCVMPLHLAGPGQISFLSDLRRIREVNECRASVLLLAESSLEKLPEDCPVETLLFCENPLRTALSIAAILTPRRQIVRTEECSSGMIDPSARIGAGSMVMPGAWVGPDVNIGRNCHVHPGVFIGPGCRLGDDVVLHPNVVLYDGVAVGDRVIIHASAVIGADGFGYELVDGRHERLPHFGSVIIEDDVEIGACSTVDRAMLGDTRVGRGTKLDNLVMIGHNCRLGEHNLMVSQVGMAGSASTGDFVVCAGQVGVGDHVHLGEHSVYGARSGVHKNMPGHNTYLGVPAEPEGDTMRILMALRKLPAMRQKMKEMERQMNQLRQEMEGLQDPGQSSHTA